MLTDLASMILTEIVAFFLFYVLAVMVALPECFGVNNPVLLTETDDELDSHFTVASELLGTFTAVSCTFWPT